MSSDRNSPAGSGTQSSAALYERVSTWIRRRVRSKRGGTDDGEASPDGNAEMDDATAKRAGTVGEITDGGTETTGDSDTPLSTEERILLILQQSGRTRQSELVDRLNWSKATVSRRLSRMEEAGRISRLTVGREKIVALPEEGFGSIPPFEDGGRRGDENRNESHDGNHDDASSR